MCCNQLTELFGNEKQHCVQPSNVAKEHGKEFRVESASRSVICRVRIDGCIIDDVNRVRCDYLFKICNTGKLILVELKGTDVLHAIEQIEATCDYLKHFFNIIITEAFIVSSVVPSAAELRFRNLQERVYKARKLKISKRHNKYILQT